MNTLVATLMLIALSAAAASILYVWASHLIDARTDQVISVAESSVHLIKIEAASINYEAGSVLVYVKNLGDSQFTVDMAYILDGAGQTVCAAELNPPVAIPGRTVTPIELSLPCSLAPGSYVLAVSGYGSYATAATTLVLTKQIVACPGVLSATLPGSGTETVRWVIPIGRGAGVPVVSVVAEVENPCSEELGLSACEVYAPDGVVETGAWSISVKVYKVLRSVETSRGVVRIVEQLGNVQFSEQLLASGSSVRIVLKGNPVLGPGQKILISVDYVGLDTAQVPMRLAVVCS